MRKLLAVCTVFYMFIGSWGTMAMAATTDWTFMVYLDGDNNLEGAGIDDFLEMSSIGSNENVKIVVQFDRTAGHDTTHDDWETCKRFYITKNMTPHAANALDDIGEANMGDPATLTSFIDWATTQYPANNYALIMWDHGDGWRNDKIEAFTKALKMAKSGKNTEEIRNSLKEEEQLMFKVICSDDTNSDHLYMSEVKSALNNATVDVDLLGFDACLMGMIEVAHHIKDTGAAVMVASEETEPGDGWPYTEILGDLQSNPTWTPAQLGISIVDRYYESYNNDNTQSAIALDQVDALSTEVSNFANVLQTKWNTDEAAVKVAAQKVMDKVDLAVIHEQHGTSWSGVRGLAIYFPSTEAKFDPNYNSTNSDFPADTLWEEYLSDFYDFMGGSWIANARSGSQQFDTAEHIDLFDFCDKLVNYTPSCPAVVGGDFEDGVVPPTNWSHIQSNPTETWKILDSESYSGNYATNCEYDSNTVDQDEWLVTPYLTNPTKVSLQSKGSIYWCRDDNDNCDLEIWLIKGDGVNDGDDIKLGKADDDWLEGYVYAKSEFEIPSSGGAQVRIGFRYVGNDGAAIAFDEVKICTGTDTDTVSLAPVHYLLLQ